MSQVTFGNEHAAVPRIGGQVRPVPVAPADIDTNADGDPFEMYLALEFMQHTGSLAAARSAGDYSPSKNEKVGLILSGTNTDVSDP